MLTYKMGFLSTCWTPRVISRVVRDVLTSQRLTRIEKICLVVAANKDLTSVLRGIMGVKTTTDVSGCEIYRLYVDESVTQQPNDPDPETIVPPEAQGFETIVIAPRGHNVGLIVEKDPYAGRYLPDRFQRIPSTIDRMRNAPKPLPNDEPSWRPFL